MDVADHKFRYYHSACWKDRGIDHFVILLIYDPCPIYYNAALQRLSRSAAVSIVASGGNCVAGHICGYTV